MARHDRGGEPVDVVVVGSVNVDLVVRVARLPGAGETVSGGTFERHGGGKGANAALAAVRASARVALVAAVGTDDDGGSQLRELTGEGIDLSGIARLEAEPTGRALIVVAESGENQIAVASGANALLNAARVGQALASVTPTRHAVCLLGFEVGDAALEVAAQWAIKHHSRVVLNPAPARALPGALVAARPILTPNEGEALTISEEADVESAARSLAVRVSAPVVVTLGADGVLVAEPATTAVRRVPAPPVDVTDTTGAGDAFNGALAARLSLGDSFESAVRWAVAAAALKVTRSGARSSPHTEEVEHFLGARSRDAIP